MTKGNVEIGDVVVSRAGRDQGKYYAVIARESEDFVLLADGDLRKLDRLKRKRVKHVKPV